MSVRLVQLSYVIRPRHNRDDASITGERLHKLADHLERQHGDAKAAHDASKEEVLAQLKGLLSPEVWGTYADVIQKYHLYA